MLRRCALPLVLLCAPALARAQDAPEQLLPKDTQVFVRWDGVAAHAAAYDKTALGKMMQGDTGKFVTGVFAQLQESAGALLTVQQVLGGQPPEQLQKLQADATEATKLFGVLAQHGFVVGIEVRKLEPPDAQLTLVIPDGGAKPASLFGALRLGASLSGTPIKTEKVNGRDVQHFQAEMVHVAWWVEGKHAVVTVGTEKPEAAVKRMTDAKTPRLTDNPLFKRVSGFKEFEVSARAFVDGSALIAMAKGRNPDVAKVIDELGVEGLKSLTFYSGFDGASERGLVEWEAPGPRKGLLRMLGGKPFRIDDVPPIPPDALSWSMTNFDPATLYDVALPVAETIAKLVQPDDTPNLREFIKMANELLGVDVRKDLLGSLGGRFVQYNSPGEGPFTLGQTILFEVKDAKKLADALEQAIKAIGKQTGANVTLKKRTYRGVEISQVVVLQEGFFFQPSYAIHNNWLVVGYYPQAVQGYVLRATGALPSWKPDAAVQAALAKMPKEMISVSVSDPRPTLKQVLSIAPLVGAAVNGFTKANYIDVGLMPNAQEATHHLFPNVSVSSDDGKVLRLETRASLALPIDVTGLDTYAAVFAVFGFAQLFDMQK